jgi:hypothetical protein
MPTKRWHIAMHCFYSCSKLTTLNIAGKNVLRYDAGLDGLILDFSLLPENVRPVLGYDAMFGIPIKKVVVPAIDEDDWASFSNYFTKESALYEVEFSSEIDSTKLMDYCD